MQEWRGEVNAHAIWIHGLARIEVKVFEVGRDLLGEIALYLTLKFLDLCFVLTCFLKLLNDLLQVTLSIIKSDASPYTSRKPVLSSWCPPTLELTHKILLSLKRPITRRFITQEIISERVNHVNDLLCTLVKAFIRLLSRGVGPNVETFGAFRHFPAIDLEDRIILLNEVVGIRDDLVSSYNVLHRTGLVQLKTK